MSGQTEALFLIGLLVFPNQVLVFFLTKLSISGEVVGGVMLTVFVLILILRLAGGFVLFLGLFNLFRELKCGVSFLQTSRAVHLGVDNLGVVRHVGRLLDGCRDSKPFELVNDGDLLLLIDRMLQQRGLDTVRISKVKGHADDGMVLRGQVRGEDKLGNDAADEAADFGRRRVSPAIIDARRNLSGVCGHWYLTILDLHRFFITISRAVVNRDGRGGTGSRSSCLVCWCSSKKRRRLVVAVRDRAFLPGPPGIWCSEWFQVPAAAICVDDIAHWPYTPGLLVKWVACWECGIWGRWYFLCGIAHSVRTLGW